MVSRQPTAELETAPLLRLKTLTTAKLKFFAVCKIQGSTWHCKDYQRSQTCMVTRWGRLAKEEAGGRRALFG